MQERAPDHAGPSGAAALDPRGRAGRLSGLQGVPPGSGAAADGRRLSAESVIRWLAAAIAVLVALAGLSMLAIHVFAPQRSGPLVFSEIFEPFLLLGLVVGALLFAFVARRRVATILLLALVVAAALRYGPLLMSFPAAAPAGA